MERVSTLPSLIPLYGEKFDRFGILFPLALILFFSVYFFNFNVDINNLFYIFFFKILINQWHVFLSFFLTLEHEKIRGYIKENLLLVLASCFVISFIGIFNVHYFKVLFGYFGLYHIIMQIYGLLVISYKRSQDEIEKKISLAAYCVFVFSSLMFWFQGFSRVPHSYMVKNNILSLPALIQASLLIGSVVLAAAVYLGYIAYKGFTKRIINQGQLCIMLGAFLIFAVGLVFARSNNLFYLLSLTFHGLTYSAHVYYAKDKAHKGAVVKYKMSVILTLIGAIIWTWSLDHFNDKEFLYPLIYSPLVIHFVFDGFIWKKNRYAQLS